MNKKEAGMKIFRELMPTVKAGKQPTTSCTRTWRAEFRICF